MKKLLLAAGASLALAFAASPAAAQDAADEALIEDVFGNIDIEPLTTEQQARLPLAREVALHVVPEGALASTMGGFFDESFIGAIESEETAANNALTAAFGYYFDFNLEQEAAEEALAIIEPGWRERQAADLAAAEEMTTLMMTAMEPALREAMAEMYAIYFNEAQLQDIAVFYATPTGAVFARASYEMTSDPQFYARMFANDALTGMFEAMGEMETVEAAETETRAFEDLSAEERRRLAVLTGQSLEDIEHALSWDYAEGEVTEEAMEDAADAMEEAVE